MKLYYQSIGVPRRFESGLHELREVLNIPVLGLMESSVHLACLMGASCSVVNVNPKFARRVTENIASTGLAHAGVHAADGVPILKGLIALLKTAEMAVKIRQLTWGFINKRMMYAQRTAKLLADIRAVYGEHVYPGAV